MTKPRRLTRKKVEGAPDWAMAPFLQILDDLERLSHVVRLSARGISMLRGTPRILEVLMEVEEGSLESKKSQLDDAKKEADLAQREVDSDFPVLHALAIVALWSHLEFLIRGFVATWLKNKRSSWQVEQIHRLRIKIGEYQSIPREQKHAFVAELLERDLGAGLKSGVTRFEKLLEPFGLSGDVPEFLRRTIYELGQVRNLIAHSAAKVDRQFVRSCPWLDVKVGSDLHVSAPMFERFYLAACAYITILIVRVGEKYGVDMSRVRNGVEDQLEVMASKKALGVTS